LMSTPRSGAPKYGAIIRLWNNAWEEFIPFVDYDVEIRTVLCSTNAIESLNARYRRAVKARGLFPTEQTALKCLYLVTRDLLNLRLSRVRGDRHRDEPQPVGMDACGCGPTLPRGHAPRHPRVPMRTPSAACRAVDLWGLVRWSFAQASAPINGSRSAYWHTVADVGAGAII